MSKPSVHVGLLAPLAGGDAAVGRAIKNGAELAVSQFDANTSQQVTATLDIEDAAATPAKAARALAAKRVVGVVGPATDSEATAADPVLERAGIPQVDVSAPSDNLADSGDSYFHRISASDGEAGDAEAEWLVNKGASTVQVVDDGLSDYSTLLTNLNETLSSDLGSQPTPYTYPARGTSALDAASDITSEEPEPDSVVFVGSAAKGGALAEALRDLAFDGNILLAGAAGDPASAATRAWVENAPDGTATLASAGDNPGSVTGQALTFVTAYTGAYGVAPPEWAAQAYDATNAILDALAPPAGDGSTTTSGGTETSGSTGAAVAVPTASDVEAALGDYRATGVSGPISFDAMSGDLTSPQVWMSAINDGEPVQQTSVTASSTASSS